MHDSTTNGEAPGRFRVDEGRLAEASDALLSLKSKPPFRQIARGEIGGEVVAISYHVDGRHIQVSFQEEDGEWDRYTVTTEPLVRHCYARRLELQARLTNDPTNR